MVKSFSFRIAVVSLGVLLWSGSALADAVPIDLSTWTVIQYELNSQPDASWVLSNGNTTATQTVNADASILLSDFDIAGQQIEGSWRVNTSSDDDFMGFVFGYQSRSQYYLFDWKQLDQTFLGDFADAGMTLKVLDIAGGADPTQDDLWPSDGNPPNVTVLRHNTIPWADFTDYNFRLNFTPGLFEIEVRGPGDVVLQNWVVADNTYTDGGFGFYNYSQGAVVYNGFTQDPDPPPIPGSEIPEPGTLLLLGTGLLAVGRQWRKGSQGRKTSL